jgi:hypothetical protein
VPNVTSAEGLAIKALAAGNASEDQQRTAWAFIVERIARASEASFVIESERATTFVEGRRFVGLAMKAIAGLSEDQLRDKEAG